MRQQKAIFPAKPRPLARIPVPSQLTSGQEILKAKHGTPEEFASAVYNALGDISIEEANNAIRTYNLEFDQA